MWFAYPKTPLHTGSIPPSKSLCIEVRLPVKNTAFSNRRKLLLNRSLSLWSIKLFTSGKNLLCFKCHSSCPGSWKILAIPQKKNQTKIACSFFRTVSSSSHVRMIQLLSLHIYRYFLHSRIHIKFLKVVSIFQSKQNFKKQFQDDLCVCPYPGQVWDGATTFGLLQTQTRVNLLRFPVVAQIYN